MINQCPHCLTALQFNSAQLEKIKAALANITSGSLKLGCPHCKKPIHLNAAGGLYQAEEKASPTAGKTPALAPAIAVVPPAYPDISWLAQGIYTEQEMVTDVPKALILMASGPSRDAVVKAFRERGYQIEMPESGNDALVQMRFGTFAAVVLHAEFDGSLAASAFHRQLAAMPMDKRRALFYALIGQEFYTLYNLEALTYSANVVVNDQEALHFDIILKKGLQEMEELFGPYAEALKRASVNS